MDCGGLETSRTQLPENALKSYSIFSIFSMNMQRLYATWIIDMKNKEERKIIVYTSTGEDSEKGTSEKDKINAKNKNKQEQNDRMCKITEEKMITNKETKTAVNSSKNKGDEARICDAEQKN